MKRILIAFLIFLLSITLIIFTFRSIREKDTDTLFKIIIFYYEPYGRPPSAHYFVIKSDGVLTSYFGTARRFGEISRRNPMTSIQERETITLSEDDFENIKELLYVSIFSRKDEELWMPSVWDMNFVFLYHDGIAHNLQGARTRYFHNLIYIVTQLSPLDVRWWYIP